MVVTLVDGPGFKLETTTLTTTQVFDYEQQDRVTVKVKVEDEEGMAAEQEFVIKVWHRSFMVTLEALFTDEIKPSLNTKDEFD